MRRPSDQALLGHLMLVAGKVAEQLGVGEAFRLVVNNGAGAGQTVFHLHLHIIGGRAVRRRPYGGLTAACAIAPHNRDHV